RLVILVILQRIQKGQQRGKVLRTQIQLLQQGIQRRLRADVSPVERLGNGVAQLVIKHQDILERLQAAVVHVRRGASKISQRRRAKFPAAIGGGVRHADEMQLEIRKHRSAMTLNAAGILENLHVALLNVIERGLIAAQEAIE